MKYFFHTLGTNIAVIDLLLIQKVNKMKKRGAGLILSSIYMMINSIINVVVSFMFWIGSSEATGYMSPVLKITAVTYGFISIAIMFSIIGLLTFQEWARKSIKYICYTLVVIGVIFMFPIFPGIPPMTTSQIVFNILMMGFYVLISYYLNKEDVKDKFSSKYVAA